ncbi:MAG: poly(A) polymerase [Desulfobulbaceae bacterium]|uniref:Poly(A) polymerase n=1 Tax=Candidatus Desulfobia pelagia TaxID=2841692 RepID=A0A8J6NGN2_9BACT|nr:poly(A) polymerase [Candidatus Desulfobia pelagia]
MGTQKKTSSSSEASEAPVIILQEDHLISPQRIDRDALKVLSRLQDAGHTAYLVGGGVRDLYMDKEPKDFDISTSARPGELRKLFRNSRTIGRRFRLVQIFFPGNHIIEVSTFRCRSEYDLEGTDKLLQSNNTFGSQVDDAFRRDLTINALMYDIKDGSILDYTGGVEDLKSRLIRIIGDPDRRITRDPVRMLRAVRHAARSDFSIEEQTWKAIQKHRAKLNLCPVSRIRDELLKDLRGGASRKWVELALDSGLFGELFPFYNDLLLKGKDNLKYRQELVAALAVADRLHEKGNCIPEYMLIGLLLLPWAMYTFPVLANSTDQNRGDAYAMSLTIRKKLDINLLHLNLKKETREQIAGLLSHIPLFASNDGGTWPNWLSKKSYFKERSHFYMMYREAGGGKPVKALIVPRTSAKPKLKKKRGSSGGGRNPVFSRKEQKGGVFGFKR